MRSPICAPQPWVCSSWRASSPRRFYVAALIASVAIDLDHIPLYLGLLGNYAQRPVTHSLSTVAVFVVAAAVSRRHRAVLAGVATGAGAPFRAGHRRGLPRGAGLLAASGHLLDGQLSVVPGDDRRARGRPAGAGERRPRADAHPRLPDGIPGRFNSSLPGRLRDIGCPRPGPRREGLILKLTTRRGPARRYGVRMKS